MDSPSTHMSTFDPSSTSHLINNVMRITKRKRDSLDQNDQPSEQWVQGSLDVAYSAGIPTTLSNPYSTSSDHYFVMEPPAPEAAWAGSYGSFSQNMTQSHHHHPHRHESHHVHPSYLHHEGLYAPSDNTVQVVVVSSLPPMTSSGRPSPAPFHEVSSPGPSDVVKGLPHGIYPTVDGYGAPSTPASSSDPF